MDSDSQGFVDELRKIIQDEQSVDLLSRAFLFDPQFARGRNRFAWMSQDDLVPRDDPFDDTQACTPTLHVRSRRTVLSVLLREAMTDQARAEIFPGKFDLGNRRTATDGECTYEALANELWVFRTIVTGHSG